jgi:Holliday junction resolvase RusA-like endonuclease
MTRNGKWVNESALRYLAYKKDIGWQIRTQMCEMDTMKSALSVRATFVMPILKSWSKKKQVGAIETYHTSKPDIDNLVKGLFDALNGVLWEDDNRVVDMKAIKIYGEKPGIKLEVKELF